MLIPCSAQKLKPTPRTEYQTYQDKQSAQTKQMALTNEVCQNQDTLPKLYHGSYLFAIPLRGTQYSHAY